MSAAASEIRFDPLRREWVVMAAHRQSRTHLPATDHCPLCPSTEDRHTEVPASSYDVVVFENRGSAIGVTMHHPHGQIYAYPFVTPRTRRELDSAHRYRERTRRNLYADVLAAEQRAEVRVVARSENWTAFVPAAARWPVEVHVYPHRQVPDLPALDEAEREDFCRLYLDLLRRFDRLYDFPLPYVAAWHQAPKRFHRELAYLHLELFSIQRAPDKLKYLAGSESAMGVFVNDLLPEDIAHRLREVGGSPGCPTSGGR